MRMTIWRKNGVGDEIEEAVYTKIPESQVPSMSGTCVHHYSDPDNNQAWRFVVDSETLRFTYTWDDDTEENRAVFELRGIVEHVPDEQWVLLTVTELSRTWGGEPIVDQFEPSTFIGHTLRFAYALGVGNPEPGIDPILKISYFSEELTWDRITWEDSPAYPYGHYELEVWRQGNFRVLRLPVQHKGIGS